MLYPRFRINMPLEEVGRFLLSALGPADGNAAVEFGKMFKEFGGFEDVVSTGSGRAGFRLLLEALDFPPGSEIIFPAYTFHPMPIAAAEHGLRPVFVDVDEKTWNIDPEKVPALVNEKTRAVVPTHLFGVPAELEALGDLAREHDLFLIEDCAHALGAVYRDRMVGNFGGAAIFTFAMSKNMPSWGGGAVAVKDPVLAGKMKEKMSGRPVPTSGMVLRRHLFTIFAMMATQPVFFPWTLYPALRIADYRGSDYFDRPFLEPVIPPRSGRLSRGGISPLSPLQAETGLRQLRRFPEGLAAQVANARRLRELLEDCPTLRLQEEPDGSRSSFLSVRAQVPDPGGIRSALLAAGVDTKPDDMKNCAALEFFGGNDPCPVAAGLGGHCIELPCSPYYSQRQIERLAVRVRAAVSPAGKTP